MSRLRSALTLSALAGPSRPMVGARAVAIRPAAVSVSKMQSRSLFGLPDMIPTVWRRSGKGKDEKEVKAEESKGEVAGKEGETGSLFEEAVEEVKESRTYTPATEHRFKSGYHKMSHRKLNDISRLVAGLPVDEAVVQVAFSDKRAARSWVKSTLVLARDHAQAKGMSREKLIVAETWVSKGRKIQRADIKGRGRMGMKHHPSARIHFVLREGKTWAEKQEEKREKALRRVKSAGIVREDGKLRRKTVSQWAW